MPFYGAAKAVLVQSIDQRIIGATREGRPEGRGGRVSRDECDPAIWSTTADVLLVARTESRRTGSEQETQSATGSRCPGGTSGSGWALSEPAFQNRPDSIATAPQTWRSGERRDADSRPARMRRLDRP